MTTPPFSGLVWPGGLTNNDPVSHSDLMELDERVVALGDTVLVLPGFARCFVTAGTYAPGDWLHLTSATSTTAPRTTSSVGAHTGGGNGDYVQVGNGTGKAAVGWWRVKMDLVVTTDPAERIGDVGIWGGQSSDPTTGTQLLSIATSPRSDPDTTVSPGRTIIRGEYTFFTSTELSKISFQNISAVPIIVHEVDGAYRKIQLEQLSREY